MNDSGVRHALLSPDFEEKNVGHYDVEKEESHSGQKWNKVFDDEKRRTSFREQDVMSSWKKGERVYRTEH